jgi:hypothetical protein
MALLVPLPKFGCQIALTVNQGYDRVNATVNATVDRTVDEIVEAGRLPVRP